MSMFDYKVVPAPRALRISLSPSAAAETEDAVSDAIALESRDGWKYVRTERASRRDPWSLRRGEVMVFRRPRDSRAPDDAAPEMAPLPARRGRSRLPAMVTRDEFEADMRRMVRDLAPLAAGAA